MAIEDARIPALQDQVRQLIEKVDQLGTQVDRLRSLADVDRAPFTYLALESNLTTAQTKRILDLMDEAEKSIKSGSPMGHHDFEQRVYAIVPSHDGNYGFAESIVSTLNQERRWPNVFKHMQANGMNLVTPSEPD